MATTAQVIVEGGYAKSSNSDPGKMASDGELLNRLNRFFQTIYPLAARKRPDEYASTATITFAGNPGASTLAAATPTQVDVLEIIGAYGVSGTVAAGAKIHLVAGIERVRTFQIAPVIFRRGLSIISRAQAGDPVATDVISLELLDSPAILSTLAINIDSRFPVRYHEILVNSVALYLMAKDGGDANRFNQVSADQRGLMEAFAQDFGIQASAIEAVFSQRLPVSAQEAANS